MRLATVLSVLVLVSACTAGEPGLPNVTQPSTVGTGAAPRPPADVIRIGEQVKDTLIGHGSLKAYELTAPSDGLLVAQLSWDPKQSPAFLGLSLEDTRRFANSSPIVARLQVSAGRTYLVQVFDNAAWDYDDMFVPFVLTTSME